MLAEDEDIDYLTMLYSFHGTLHNFNLDFVYEGEVNQAVTKKFAGMMEQELSASGVSSSVIRKVYHLMVECLQNIQKHAALGAHGKEGRSKFGAFILAHDNERYYVSTGNLVNNEAIDRLGKDLNKINESTKDEIKDLYKAQMRNTELSDKGGAGLGFMDIYRKTGNQLRYLFERMNDQNSVFLLSTSVNK